MTLADERALYESDPIAWARYAAPRVRDAYRYADPIAKREAWARCSPMLQVEILRLKTPMPRDYKTRAMTQSQAECLEGAK